MSNLTSTTNNQISYTIIYRTGGIVNFKWNTCVPILVDWHDESAIESEITALERMGYAAKAINTKTIQAIGLPDTYEGNWL